MGKNLFDAEKRCALTELSTEFFELLSTDRKVIVYVLQPAFSTTPT
jgi:hypothetical protein